MHPLSLADLRSFWYTNTPWGSPPVSMGQWLGEGFSILIGWLLTIVLLSVGAPFWEDVLESLFGVKTMLQQKTAAGSGGKGSGAPPSS
jgi:hypothetical protein